MTARQEAILWVLVVLRSPLALLSVLDRALAERYIEQYDITAAELLDAAVKAAKQL